MSAVTDQPLLEPLAEDWERALAVVAHPDDMEYGAASAVARWTDQGKQVAYLLVTRGEAGIASMPPDEVAPIRAEEQRASCAAVGVTELAFLDHRDGLVEASLGLRRDLAEAIRRNRPDVVLSINFRDSWGGPSWNHVDHRNVGVALLDAVRDAGNRWVFTEQLDEGLTPWTGVRQVWAAGSPLAAHGVDITDTFDAGVASLRAHDAYIAGLGWDDFDPSEFLEGAARMGGTRMGVPLATSFEVLKLGWDD